MESVEFSLPAAAWQGLVTKFPADTKKVGPDQFTGGSFNFLTHEKGIVTKRSGGVFYNDTAFPTPAKDQYEAVFSSGIRHLLVVENGNLRYSSGGGVFSLVTAGYTATGNMEFSMYRNRVYFGNGIDAPQVYDIINSYGGVAYTVPQTRMQGAQPPVTAPTFGADTAGGFVPAGAHTYKVTFLYYDAEESNGGPATGVHTVVNPNNTVNLTAVPIGGYGVTARKIYRDDNDGNWVLIGTLSDNTTTIFADTLALGTTPIPTNNGLPPLYSLIVTHRDRLWVAGVADDPNNVYFSEAGLPNIFFVNNRVPCNPRDPITAIAVYNDKVIVFNRNSMGQILGTDSSSFRYAEISPSVGCVDNRSIQIRTIRGVPTVVWLSTVGFYQFNGSSISQASEEIEDQLQFNIQQALQVKGRNTQTTQADFTAGTSSPGINLTNLPGIITTDGYMQQGMPGTLTTNPTKQWDTETEWENGTSLVNLVTNENSNQISSPTLHAPAYASGTHNGTIPSGINVTLTQRPATSGESLLNISDSFTEVGPPFSEGTAAQPLQFTQNGTITNIIAEAYCSGGVGFKYTIWNDSGGVPSSILYQGPTHFNVPLNVPVGESISFAVTAGVRYWVGYVFVFVGSGGRTFPVFRRGPQFVAGLGVLPRKRLAAPFGTWITDPQGTALSMNYTFVQTAVAASGIWVGPVYDTRSDSAVSANIQQIGSFPALTSGVTTVEASNDPGMGIVSSQTFPNLNGTTAVSLSNFRYWRIKVFLSTTDDRVVPQSGPATLTYNTTSTWESEVVDHTTDITSLDALVMVSTTPGGTTTLVEIATSPDNVIYSAYTSLGSAIAQRYSKIRVTLTTDAGNTVTATVSSVRLDWTLMSNLISQAIDTGNVPAGWELFQTDFSVNGGTVSFDVRTASTIPGLTGATWTPVTNGAFITAAVNQFAQWRVMLTSHANQVPQIESVTINWLIQNVASIRVASLFYNKQYYLAAAEFDETFNNVVFVYDENNTWTVFRGLNINTMGTFFNDAYYGSSVIGKMVKWLDPQILTDQGTSIEFDLRTKAFASEIGDETKTKFLRSLVCKFLGTGARFTPTYSVDGGMTFLPLVDVETGLAYFDTTANSRLVTVRFTPSGTNVQSGRTLMLRLYNNDSNPVEVHSMRARCWISPREVLHG